MFAKRSIRGQVELSRKGNIFGYERVATAEQDTVGQRDRPGLCKIIKRLSRDDPLALAGKLAFHVFGVIAHCRSLPLQTGSP